MTLKLYPFLFIVIHAQIPLKVNSFAFQNNGRMKKIGFFQHKAGVLRLANHQGLFNGTLNSETNIPHGFGTIRYFKGDRFNRFNYTGQWDNGVIVGGGIIYWNTGARSVQDLYLNCHTF